MGATVGSPGPALLAIRGPLLTRPHGHGQTKTRMHHNRHEIPGGSPGGRVDHLSVPRASGALERVVGVVEVASGDDEAGAPAGCAAVAWWPERRGVDAAPGEEP